MELVHILRRLRPLCICAGFFIQLSLVAQNSQPGFIHQTWHSEQGLPGTGVFSILQPRDGHLWITTSEGIFRFDGTQFIQVLGYRIYESDTETQLPLMQSNDGSVWGCASNGLARICNGQVTTYANPTGLLTGNILTFFQDKTGTIWIGSSNGLWQIVDNTNIALCPQVAHLTGAIRDIIQDKSDTLWFGTDQGLFEQKNGNSILHPRTDNLSEKIRCLCLAQGGGLWVGGQDGLGLFKNGAWQSLPSSSILPRNFVVHALYEEPSGELWIGGSGGVLLLKNGALCTPTTLEHSGLQSGNIPGMARAICRGKEGNLWIGTSTGLSQIRRPAYSTYDESSGLPENATSSVLKTKDGTVWIGTQHGWLSRIRDGMIDKWRVAQCAVLAICKDRNGNLWVGTEQEGLLEFLNGEPSKSNTPDTYTHYTASTNGLPDNNVRVLYQDSRGVLWIGGSNSLCRFTKGQFFKLPNFSQIHVITEDASENLWIGSKMALTCVSNSKLHTFNRLPSVPRTSVNALYPEPDGSLWIGCDTGDLLRYKNHVFKRCGLTPDIFEKILHLSKDNQGNLWIASRNGIIRASTKELNDFADNGQGFVDCIKLDGSQLNQNAWIGQGGIEKSSDGRMWFSGSLGVFVVDPNTLREKHHPGAIIEQIFFNGQTVNPGTWLTQSNSNSSSLDIRFCAPSLRMPGNPLFRCKLEGREEWRDLGSRRFVHYDNLTPGTYKFQIAVRSCEGVWNPDAASFSFRIRQPFYRSYVFYAVALSLLFCIFVTVNQMRIRHLRQREEQLQRLVQERTAKLQSAVTELEHFSYTITHDMRAPLRAMRGYGDILLEQSDHLPPESATLIRRINKAGSRMDRLITDALDYNKLVRKELPLQPVDVKSLLLGMIDSYAHFQMPQANISIQEKLPWVIGNEAALTQCFSNLLNNAVKFVRDGQTPQIRIWAENHGKVARFWVADNGIGIPNECKEKIFIIFHRANAKYEGTGIGLALVKKAAERMGGRVGVESKEGNGSQFWMEFQKATGEQNNP